MHAQRLCAALRNGLALVLFLSANAAGQHEGHGGEERRSMWSTSLGGWLRLTAMGQVHPVVDVSAAGATGSALRTTSLYATQPALMLRLSDTGERISLRTTLNFEGLTQREGEQSAGAWGEGFIDRRHPHTLLHEVIVSVRFTDVGGGVASISAGKGFAPYGTDDPMSRPGLKYPTNHHLSQILERWMLSGAYSAQGWSLEAGLFGGGEPEGPYDFSNIESFADSWSFRLTRRLGPADGIGPAWEISGSYGDVKSTHGQGSERTQLYNTAVRHTRTLGRASVYALVEASRSNPEQGEEMFSLLGEARLDVASHQPYVRLEYARRPEYVREAAAGDAGFFRYDHDSEPAGATRWLIGTAAYAYSLTGYPFSIRPFVDVQFYHAMASEGPIEPRQLFGRSSFWGIVVGARILIGGDVMRMGAYGALDGMAPHAGTMQP